MCVKIILAIQVSAMLNDESLCMQGCVQIFELLSPIIYWKLSIYPALQVNIFSKVALILLIILKIAFVLIGLTYILKTSFALKKNLRS